MIYCKLCSYSLRIFLCIIWRPCGCGPRHSRGTVLERICRYDSFACRFSFSFVSSASPSFSAFGFLSPHTIGNRVLYESFGKFIYRMVKLVFYDVSIKAPRFVEQGNGIASSPASFGTHGDAIEWGLNCRTNSLIQIDHGATRTGSKVRCCIILCLLTCFYCSLGRVILGFRCCMTYSVSERCLSVIKTWLNCRTGSLI